MLKFSRLPLSLLAMTIAGPVLAAEPAATTTHPAPAPTMAPAKPSAMPQATIAPKAEMVDVNSASATDLKALPGITDAEAAKIVQGRPYKNPSDLVSKKILSEAEFAKIKDRLVAGHPKS
ncbi:MAG TPA: helix-hairpin-helix domain-containing protein [Stellaceae bacterium]|jgi:DNA uptake protein ComE-like DNA-binding protein|nr:helix-hairpin-helix domain-containing protein [Stellaceae bacterium]